MALGCLDVVLTLPVYVMVNVANSLEFPIESFWHSWSAVHAWPSVSEENGLLVPASVWKPAPWAKFIIVWDEWIIVILAIVFFLLFGLTNEAQSNYSQLFWWISAKLGIKRKSNVMQDELSGIVYGSFRARPGEAKPM